LQSFAAIDLKGAEQIRIEIDGLQSQLALAEAQLGRLTSLHKKGYATDTKVEEAQKAVIALRQVIEGKRVELKSRVELAGANIGKRHYTGANIVGDVGLIEAQVRLAEHEIQLFHQRFLALANHRARLAVTAPFDGTVLELPHVDNGHVRRGDVIAVIEQRAKRHVLAFLTQDEVMKVGLGDEVTLFIAAVGETLKGRVTGIDRTTGFIAEQNARTAPGYRWRGSVDRSAKVTITFDDPTRVADAERYRSGTPVIAIFPQRSTNSLMASIRNRISRAM
ncbi:MAG TPA: HlyD family efflux transporter periplasmic adaptor subunit, partial [Hyphomicrobiaceae bacterium]|nr:HlyD family efflux transporter periplasmic adaptor subunit [Hyphomicrobiaceae bacterium]